MKRLFSLVLVLAMLFTLCSCGKKNPIEDEELVAQLQNAVQNEAISFILKDEDFGLFNVSTYLATIHELDELEEGKYDASGEVMVMMKDGALEYVGFNAIMNVNSSDEVEFESLEWDE